MLLTQDKCLAILQKLESIEIVRPGTTLGDICDLIEMLKDNHPSITQDTTLSELRAIIQATDQD